MPFVILTPQSLPDGYLLRDISLVERPDQGGEAALINTREVNGVALRYTKAGNPNDSFVESLFVEQFLGEKFGGYQVGRAQKIAVQDVRGFSTDVWKGQNALGREQYTLVWQDESRGIFFHMVSYLSEQETLQVARSFR